MPFTAKFSGLNLLIVDDDAATRALLARLANHWGYMTTQCASAEEAIESLRFQKANIVVTDIRMRKMNGLEFAQIIREKMPSIAVVMITGYPSEKTAQKSLELGATYYLQKPISADEFGETLRIATAWNIGMLADRGARRYQDIFAQKQTANLDIVKEAIRRLLRAPGASGHLRDLVYSSNVGSNPLLLELQKRFSA